jgi:hypothetical protein
MKDFTSIRNNVNIYRLDEYYEYLKEKEETRKALLMMKKNIYFRKYLGYRLGAYKIVGVLESEGKFALSNGTDIIYVDIKEALAFMKALQERV